MAPRTASQLLLLKESKKQRILEAALRQFSTHGYEGATISMIAREAGIAKGLLYSYFESKEQLLDALLLVGLEKIKNYTTALPAASMEDRESFAAGLNGMVSLFTAEQEFWRLYCMLILQKNASARFKEEVGKFLSEFMEAYTRYFDKRGSANPLAEAMLLGAVLDGLMLDLMLIPGYPIDDVIAVIVEKFA